MGSARFLDKKECLYYIFPSHQCSTAIRKIFWRRNLELADRKGEITKFAFKHTNKSMVMVLDGLIAKMLNKFLGQYVHHIDGSNVKIAVTKGDIVLTNLQLSKTFPQKLFLPFILTTGTSYFPSSLFLSFFFTFGLDRISTNFIIKIWNSATIIWHEG